MPPQRTVKREGHRVDVIDLIKSEHTTEESLNIEAICNGAKVDDEEESKRIASKLMRLLLKQDWIKWALRDEMAADVGRDAMSTYKDSKDCFLESFIESENEYGMLSEWAKEQFKESEAGDEAREEAKREIKQQVEHEIRSSPQRMAALERNVKRKLEREIRADPARLARVHEMIRIRDLVPNIVQAVTDTLEDMDQEARE